MNIFVTIRSRFSLFIRVLFAMLLALFLVTTLAGCYMLPEEEEVMAPPVILKEPTAKKIITEKVRRGNIENKIDFWGFFMVPDQKNLFFTDTGTLKFVNVAYGDYVKAGDVLARLESEELDLQLAQLEINHKKAILAYDSLLSKAKMDGSNNDIEVKNAKLDIDSLKISIDYIKKKLSMVSIIAPNDGMITYVSPLKPGTLLMTRVNFITICVPKNFTLVVKEDQITEPLLAGKELTVNYNSKTYQGKVVKTPEDNLNEINANFKNAYIIQVEGLDESLIKLNDTAYLEYMVSKADDVLLIDKSNIMEDSGKKIVNVYKDGIIEEREIETGLEAYNGVDIEITKGLTEADELLVP